MRQYPELILQIARDRVPERWPVMPAAQREALCARVHHELQLIFATLTAHGLVLVPPALDTAVLTDISVACPVGIDGQIMALDTEVIRRVYDAALSRIAIPRPKPPAAEPEAVNIKETANAQV